MKNNIYKIIELSLMSNKKYVSDKNELLKTIVYEDAMNMDRDLLNLLMANDQIKEKFFSNINGILVFDKQAFIWILESKEFLPDSYTKYTNKIGLTNNDKFISKSNGVVLDFPYKDCVLAGGQDRDDQKKEEILYNEIIADDVINKMLSPKMFFNAKRYTNEGIEKDITFNDDNLIIKGNNLIAMASLLKKYEGKIKCIFIDPPYNTDNDSFKYNDSFGHSSWLTFMKNRLELAKRLLSYDGVIFTQCDDNEQAYLKVLMDEIFGRDNFVNTLAVKMSPSSGVKRSSKETRFIKNKEYILVYKKEKLLIKPLIDPTDVYDTHYSIYFDGNICTSLANKIKEDLGENIIKQIKCENYLKYDITKNYILRNVHNIYRTHNPSEWAKDNFDNSDKSISLCSGTIKKVYNNSGEKYEYIKVNKNNKLDRLEPLSWKLTDDLKHIGILRGDFWDVNYEGDMGNINKEGGRTGFGQGQKPERLIKDILK